MGWRMGVVMMSAIHEHEGVMVGRGAEDVRKSWLWYKFE